MVLMVRLLTLHRASCTVHVVHIASRLQELEGPPSTCYLFSPFHLPLGFTKLVEEFITVFPPLINLREVV